MARITGTEHDAKESLRPRSCYAASSARSTALATQPRRDIALSFELRSQTPAGAKQSDWRDSERRDSEVGRTVPERYRAASARFRLKRSLGLVAEPMLYRRTDHPSRRRIVRPAAEGLFFHGAKRSAEPTGSRRRARPNRL